MQPISTVSQADHSRTSRQGESLPIVQTRSTQTLLSAQDLIALAIECGADDAGCISLDRIEMNGEREVIQQHAPWTKTLLSFVVV